jgi:hypothetical protein
MYGREAFYCTGALILAIGINGWVYGWGVGGSISIRGQRFTNLVIQTEHAKKDTDNVPV